MKKKLYWDNKFFLLGLKKRFVVDISFTILRYFGVKTDDNCVKESKCVISVYNR